MLNLSYPSPEVTRSFPVVRACIFDLDGLLVNSEDIYTEAYNLVLHEYNKSDLPWGIKARLQSGGRRGNLVLLKWAQLPISVEEFHAKVSAHRDLFRESQPLPGVLELLTNLTKRASPPVYTALATSSRRGTFHVKTDHLPSVISAFPETCQVCADDAAMAGRDGKPAPDIFLLALERINKTLSPQDKPIVPQDCLVFEDSIAGVEAGRRAGMRVVWVPHPGLLDVCRGKEDLVLAGNTEGFWDEVGEGEKGQGDHYEEAQGQDLSGRPRKSKDGWAELRTSLEDFPYESYGIHVRPANDQKD